MRRHRNQGGFALFFVVIFLSLMGIFLAVLSNTSRNYAGEVVEKLLRSNCRQFLASGIAWAGQNPDKVVDLGQAGTFQLDVNAINVRQANCIVKLINVAEKTFEVEITTSCTKGRLKAKKNTRAIFKRDVKGRITGSVQ